MHLKPLELLWAQDLRSTLHTAHPSQQLPRLVSSPEIQVPFFLMTR